MLSGGASVGAICVYFQAFSKYLSTYSRRELLTREGVPNIINTVNGT